MYCTILCGGSGTRLWPLSRQNFPKQFLSLYSDKSLLQETFLRMVKIVDKENIFFITNKENYFNVLNQIKNVYINFDKSRIIIEPLSLNTAPSIALVAKYLEEIIKIKPTDPIISLHADAYIENKEKYNKIVKNALAQVDDNIGTIGITPTKPETGFGYIKKGHKVENKNAYYVLEFKEKPDKEKAKQYFDSGEYFWNSGIYIFNIQTLIQEFKKYEPSIFKLLQSNYSDFVEKFNKLSEISIDHAIAEKSNKVIVFEGDFGWRDIGSFDSLAEISTIRQAEANNKNIAQHIPINSNNIFINSTSNRLIATIGVEDLNIIDTNDSILIQKKGQGESVKQIVLKLKEQKSKEIQDSLIVYRPWGRYEVLIDQPNYKVKKITVYPQAKLSLQSHNKRAEHWIIVSGTAKIVNGDKEFSLEQNESTFIPIKTRHRLENEKDSNLEIIEVQTGAYLEEDDIVRYEDIYDRN